MPEYFLNRAGVEIKHFKGKKAGFSGSHDATIALVNSGAFDAGAVSYTHLTLPTSYAV